MVIDIQIVSESWGGSEGIQRRKEPSLTIVASNLFARDVVVEKARQDYWAHQKKCEFPRSIAQSELSSLMDAPGALPVDEEEAASIALEAFAEGDFLFFWNENQVQDLEERLADHEENEALFVRLFPLVGG